MTFQEIDFHIELFKAYLEPKEARFAYLDLLKKKSGYPKDAFFAKLDQAYNNLRQAWEDFHSLRTSKLIGDKNIGLPISGFNRYPVLLNFSMAFDGHINSQLIKNFEIFLFIYKSRQVDKLFEKAIKKAQSSDKANDENSINDLENKFNQMPIEQVRDHFKHLIEKKNPSGEIWMTEKDFEIFLKRSFGGQTKLSKPKINVGSRGKFALVKLFHNFYFKTLNHPYNETRETDKVFNLLKDAFETSIFNNVRKDNFKPTNSKYLWD